MASALGQEVALQGMCTSNASTNLKGVKGIESAKEWHKSKEGIEWHREHGKKTWVNRQKFKKNCIVCGKEYETPCPKTSKFCHQNCKAKSLRERRKL